MRNNVVLDVHHSGNLAGREVKATFDENAIVHLMSVLTDLYSDPIETTIREYSTNARDSHAEAGNDAPIEVTLPNDLNPVFTVQDFGVGLSYDGLSETYLKYGRSTKRDTDEQTGTLGLGSKSALAYTAMFTVTAVKNGLKTVAVILRGEDGSGAMRVQDTVATDEPNGVKVAIPVSNVKEFNRRAHDFYRFWRPGTVLVNGKEPETINGAWLDEDILLTNQVDHDVIVMGGVPYPVNEYQFRHLSPVYSRKVVAWVPMGAVNFTPNREALNYSALTRETLATIEAYVDDTLRAGVQAELDQAASHTEALTLAYDKHSDIMGALGWKNFHYQGQTLPRSFNLSDPYARRYDGDRAEKVRSLDVSRMFQRPFAIIWGHGNKSFPATNREKLDKYCDQHNITERTFILTNEKFGGVWTQHLTHIKWDDVAAIKVERPKYERSNNGPAYRILSKSPYGSGHTVTRVDDLSDYDRLVYLSPTDQMDTDTAYRLFSSEDTAVVLLNKNRWDKFKREYPHAKHAKEARDDAAKECIASMTAGDLYLLHTPPYDRSVITSLDPDVILDPELQRVVALVATDAKAVARWDAIRNAYGYYNAPTLPDDTLAPVVEALHEKYPLLDGNRRGNVEHLTEYVNALYTVKHQNEEN